MDVNTDQRTLEEVKMAIKVMKNKKVPGSDGVTAEMLKVEDTVIPRLLTQMFSASRKQKTHQRTGKWG